MSVPAGRASLALHGSAVAAPTSFSVCATDLAHPSPTGRILGDRPTGNSW